MSAVLAAGLILLAAAAALDLVAGARWPRLMSVPYLLGAAGSGCLAATGAGVLAGQHARLAVSGWLGPGTLGLTADRLSGLFLLISFVAATGVSLAFASWAARPSAAGRPGPAHVPAGGTLAGRRGLGASYALALGAVAVITTATDAFTRLVRVGDADRRVLPAGWLRARAARPPRGRVPHPGLRPDQRGGAAARPAAARRPLALAEPGFVQPRERGAARDAAEALLFAGFAVKVGLVPFQVWMPRGYPAAPGPGPGDHGRGGGQRRVLRPVAQLQPVRRRRRPG